MILPQVLGAALLVVAGFDPIDRAHGAKPSPSVSKQVESSEPGYWERIKGRLFRQESQDETTQATSRSGQSVSTAHSAATPDDEEKVVRSSISLRQWAARRLNWKQGSPEDKNAKLESKQRDLQPAPNSDAVDSSHSASDTSIRKNHPNGERKLVTRVDSHPRWTTPPSLVLAARSNATDKTASPTTIASAGATTKVGVQSDPMKIESSGNTKPDGGAKSIESTTHPAAPTAAATLILFDPSTNASESTAAKLPELAGPALIDPNSTGTAGELSRIAANGDNVAAIAEPANSGDTLPNAVPPSIIALQSDPDMVEAANLEVEDQDAPAQIAQTGFVHRSTPDGSTTRQARVSASGSETSHSGILSRILSPALCERLDQLPIECYPIGGILLVCMLALLISRGRPSTATGAQPTLVNVAGHSAGSFSWQPSLVVPQAACARRVEPPLQTRGGFAGAITATIGLAIVAVGATAVLRAQVAGQTDLIRPGVTIAAAGQFVLLFGIVALTLRSRRLRIARQSAAFGVAHAAPVVAHPFVAGTVPYMTLGSTFGWPTAAPAPSSPSHQSGQIAQLKAQLACLSQQLDHLGVGETPGPAKSA